MSKTPEQKAARAAYMREYYNKRKLVDPDYHQRVLEASRCSQQRINADPERAAAQRERNAKNAAARRSTEEGRQASNEAARRWRSDPENSTAQNKRNSERNKKNRASINARRRERHATEPEYRLAHVLRARLSIAFKRQSVSKRGKESALQLVGCTMQELQVHLASQFEPWMTMENYGEWEIDHKIPVSRFNLACPLERLLAFHFTNLQPLAASANRKKYNKFHLAA